MRASMPPDSAIRTLAMIFIAIGLFSAVLTFVADLRGGESEVTMAEATGEDIVEGEIAGQVARAEADGETDAVAVETVARQPFWNLISLPFVTGLGIILGGGLLSGGPAGREIPLLLARGRGDGWGDLHFLRESWASRRGGSGLSLSFDLEVLWGIDF